MMDLLRPGVNTEEIAQWIANKRELTDDDLEQISTVADMIKLAAQSHRTK